MKKQMQSFCWRFKPFKLAFMACVCVALILLVFFYAKEVTQGAQTGVQMVLNSLVPSLFPFMVLSCFIVEYGLTATLSKPFGWLTKLLFGLPKEYGSIVLMSMIGGYPVGAKTISACMQRGQMDAKTASVMLCYCANAGPAFLVNVVGLQIFGDMRLGLVLLASHVLASVTTGFVLRFLLPKNISSPAQPKQAPFSQAFVTSVGNAGASMLSISFFVILFCALIALIQGIFQSGALVRNEWLEHILAGLLEVTTGCNISIQLARPTAFYLCAFFVSFCGGCVICQILACFSHQKINFKPFLLTRITSGLLTVIYARVLVSALHMEQAVFSNIGSSPVVAQTHTGKIVGILCLVCMCFVLVCQKRGRVQNR